MSDRLTDETVTMWAGIDSKRPSTTLAREVLASRKLIADLRALHRPDRPGSFCYECDARYPCPTIRLIDEAGRE